MSGIYIHVPYCKRKCVYCDFYSESSENRIHEFDKLISKEISLRKEFLSSNRIETIYFGGGTPSLLKSQQLTNILSKINDEFSLSPNPEITLEANPDDITRDYLKSLFQAGVNRLSIGVQSFIDGDLEMLGRRHNSNQAVMSVELAAEVGFSNISIDLIYGLPSSNSNKWEANLQKAILLPVNHLSCYHLIYEDNTPLFRDYSKGIVRAIDEDESVEQFRILQSITERTGFLHYEISNFAKEGFFSKHNSSYWKQVPYLGLGPSAHSYNRKIREWNPRSIVEWSKAIDEGIIRIEKEVLSERDKLNEYILTSLRTSWGVSVDELAVRFGKSVLDDFQITAEKHVSAGRMQFEGKAYRINPQHFFISDGIISDFLKV